MVSSTMIFPFTFFQLFMVGSIEAFRDVSRGEFGLPIRRRALKGKKGTMKGGKRKKMPKKARTEFEESFFLEMSMSLPGMPTPTPSPGQVSSPPPIGFPEDDSITQVPTTPQSISPAAPSSFSDDDTKPPAGPSEISDDQTHSPAGPSEFSDDASPTISPAPTTTLAPSQAPSSNPTPTLFQEDFIFVCTDTGVNMADRTTLESATLFDFQVGYLVEMNTTVDETALEEQILSSALTGALQCILGGAPGSNSPSDLNLNLTSILPHIQMNTTATDSICFPQVSLLNDCTVYETTFQVILGGDVDPEFSTFLGYVQLQENMNGLVFSRALDGVDRVEYLSPLPLLPPLFADGNQTGGITTGNTDGPLSVTPITVGAVVAVCIGGMAALWVWTRNRQTRNRRHMHLLEESSLVSPEPTDSQA